MNNSLGLINIVNLDLTKVELKTYQVTTGFLLNNNNIIFGNNDQKLINIQY